MNSAHIQRLLRSLNEWAAQREAPPGQDPLADTGEVGSRIQALIAELAALGQRVALRDGRYVIQEGEQP
ncbi:hypothetical protein HNP55_001434 [Paucibacter oligotrophus]|uniref:Uncharacterized protein n=1 Tax=Roseateles oligotrophus TaxID=1769250 RepID=A0A840L9W9_9BURK|nr:hypothetical protein [Roseateles oligotrophus]MBB4842919.1 hypothetical protein [Roseateles oligotrophus]